MSAWLGAVLLVAGFALLCKLFGLLPGTRRVLHVAQHSFAVLGDAALPDETKEKALQANALKLFRLFALLAAGGAAAFALPLAGLWGADRFGVLSWDEVLATALSWPFLLIVSGSMVAGLFIARRRRKRSGRETEATPATSAPQEFENRYSTTDRWLHDLAFATVPAQVALSEIEDRVHRRALRAVNAEQPVFITSLPRAGTTLLLELCAGLDEFVPHTYRRMPFVFTPLLWERLSRAFRVESRGRERAHGDGMTVSVDSPEALEEMLWLAFWPGHYEADRVRPWAEDEAHPEFLRFFRSHLRKIVLTTHGPKRAASARYVSKNNANIARARWLASALPDAQILVPFREPLQHAASLLRQHRNFGERHRIDDFARRYMAAIGHFDFGANLRPVDFDGWLGPESPAVSAEGLNFWLRYWTVTYRRLIDDAARVGAERMRLVDFDGLCAAPESTLGEVADFLRIRERASFVEQGRRIRTARRHPVDTSEIAPDVLARAREVHVQLVAFAVC